MRAMTSRGSNGMRRSAGTMPTSSSGSNRGSVTGPGGGPCLRQFSLATMRRPMRIASSSSTREVVGESRSAGVHLGTAEGLVVGFLAGGHLHQRGTGQEDLGPFPDHHDVVGHSGDVGAARGRVTEDQGDGRDARRREAGEVPEHLPAGDEDLLLGRQVRAAGLHQRDHRKPVLQRDLIGAQDLLQCPRIARAALDRRVVGHDDALDTFDNADAGHHARAHGEVGSPCREWAQFQERRVGVDQHFDALTRGHLAAVVVALDVLLAASGQRLGVLGVEFGELGGHHVRGFGERRRPRVDGRFQRGHLSTSSAEREATAKSSPIFRRGFTLAVAVVVGNVMTGTQGFSPRGR